MDAQAAPPGAFIRIECPARACGKEIVALVGEGKAMALLTRGQVRSHAVRVVFLALRADFTFPIAAAVGTALLTAFLALWQLLNPRETGDNMRGVLALIGGGAAIVAVFGMSIVGDFAIGVRSWRASLPRPLIDVKAMPRDYRT